MCLIMGITQATCWKHQFTYFTLKLLLLLAAFSRDRPSIAWEFVSNSYSWVPSQNYPTKLPSPKIPGDARGRTCMERATVDQFSKADVHSPGCMLESLACVSGCWVAGLIVMQCPGQELQPDTDLLLLLFLSYTNVLPRLGNHSLGISW